LFKRKNTSKNGKRGIKMEEIIKELTIMLLYLTRWEEKEGHFPKPLLKSWKGYPFGILNKLDEEGYLYQGKHPSRSKSVVLTDKGIQKAEELKRKYLGIDV